MVRHDDPEMSYRPRGAFDDRLCPVMRHGRKHMVVGFIQVDRPGEYPRTRHGRHILPGMAMTLTTHGGRYTQQLQIISVELVDLGNFIVHTRNLRDERTVPLSNDYIVVISLDGLEEARRKDGARKYQIPQGVRREGVVIGDVLYTERFIRRFELDEFDDL